MQNVDPYRNDFFPKAMKELLNFTMDKSVDMNFMGDVSISLD